MSRLNKAETGGKLRAGALAVTTTPQVVVATNSQRVSLTMRNQGSGTVFLGGPSVIAATGYPMLSGEEYALDDYLGDIWAVSTTTADLRFWEVF